MGDSYRSGTMSPVDLVFAAIGIIWSIVWSVFSDLRNWFIQLIAGVQLSMEAAAGPVFIIAVAIGLGLLIIKLVFDAFD